MVAVAAVMLMLVAASSPVVAQESVAAFSPLVPVTTPRAEPQPLPDTTPLAITLVPTAMAKGQTMQFVTITLTNTSDHAVSFPMPDLNCSNTAAGSIKLSVSPAANVTAAPCTTTAVPVAAGKEAAAIQKWTTLKPGETANFGELLNPLLPRDASTVEVKAIYTAPQPGSAMQEELYRESVVYPTESLTSAAATVAVPARESE